MKRLLYFLLVFLGLGIGAALADEAPYRHIVLFKFKDSAAAAEVNKEPKHKEPKHVKRAETQRAETRQKEPKHVERAETRQVLTLD